MDEKDNKPVVLITGCSKGGIGHALAQAFAAENCMVVATARSRSAMSDLENDPRFHLQELDVQSEQKVRRVVSNVVEKFGQIDVVVNNAGVHCIGPVAEIPLSTIQNTYDTNVLGPLRLVQAVVPHMASRKKGKIVNVGSIVAFAPAPFAGGYSSSKAALHALTDSLRLEVRPFGIDVINVVPGLVKSNIANSAIASCNNNGVSQWKLYHQFEEAIQARARFTQSSAAKSSTPTEEFAKKTVNVVLKKKPPPWFSAGHLSMAASLLNHLPLFVKDFIARKGMEP
nr:NADPH-dependent 1-acyldihydroxyacetone phosphate reductase-like [Ipomoea batatas]